MLRQMDMERLINGAHSPFADLLHQAVIAQPLARFQRLLDIGRGDLVRLTELGSIPKLLELWLLEKAFGTDKFAHLIHQIVLLALHRRQNVIAVRAALDVVQDLLRLGVVHRSFEILANPIAGRTCQFHGANPESCVIRIIYMNNTAASHLQAKKSAPSRFSIVINTEAVGI
ncbi:hypothetical protein N9B88_03370 [Rubripirellula sp.]|nr:hypothetical protein [Rubripirellula sp.]